MGAPRPLGLLLHIAETSPVRRTLAANIRTHFLEVDLRRSPRPRLHAQVRRAAIPAAAVGTARHVHVQQVRVEEQERVRGHEDLYGLLPVGAVLGCK